MIGGAFLLQVPILSVVAFKDYRHVLKRNIKASDQHANPMYPFAALSKARVPSWPLAKSLLKLQRPHTAFSYIICDALYLLLRVLLPAFDFLLFLNNKC